MRLTKHHGLGNDFLVLLDFDNKYSDAPALARVLCDRRRGIGADGLIRVLPGTDGADVTMELHNADGSRAEMSGNGIRCMAQAVVDNGVHGIGDMAVATDAGIRQIAVLPSTSHWTAEVLVEMGPATVLKADDREAEVSTGNPHLVIRDQDRALDLLTTGLAHPDVNVELIEVRNSEITMRVHERGAGITLACGTGSVASAAAANHWGLVGPHVVVHNPGGDLIVDLKEDAAWLTGPAQFIARIEVPAPS
jgi:diaminopimelate epimerase